MFDDFKELLSVFNAHSVKYLIVGGYAVSFHSQPRATKDLDLFIRADPANAKATYSALASFGAPLSNFNVEDLSDPQIHPLRTGAGCRRYSPRHRRGCFR